MGKLFKRQPEKNCLFVLHMLGSLRVLHLNSVFHRQTVKQRIQKIDNLQLEDIICHINTKLQSTKAYSKKLLQMYSSTSLCSTQSSLFLATFRLSYILGTYFLCFMFYFVNFLQISRMRMDFFLHISNICNFVMSFCSIK